MQSVARNPRVPVFLAAGVGGSAPNWLRLANIMISTPGHNPALSYFGALLIYFLLGGIVALIFKETDIRKAFFLGIGLPALITSAQGGSGPEFQKQSLLEFLAPAKAYAETVDHSAAKESKLRIKSGMDCPDCIIWFYDADGNLLAARQFPQEPGEYAFLTPHDAHYFGIWNPSISRRLWNFDQQNYQFNYKRNWTNDFWRGLGNENLRSYDSVVEPYLPNPTLPEGSSANEP